MRILPAFALCLAVMTGCSNHAPANDAAAPQRSASQPAPEPSATDIASQNTDSQNAALLEEALKRSPLTAKVMSRAWNGDLMQVGVRSELSKPADQLSLCKELSATFGTGYGLKQILVTVVPYETDKPLPPEVSWSSKTNSCIQDPPAS